MPAPSPHAKHMPMLPSSCSSRSRQTPLDLVVDVSLLQLPRHVSEDMIQRYGLSAASPFFCHNWTWLLPCQFNREMLLSIPDLHSHLLSRLDGLIAQETARVATEPEVWAHLARRHRDLYEQVRSPPFSPLFPLRAPLLLFPLRAALLLFPLRARRP